MMIAVIGGCAANTSAALTLLLRSEEKETDIPLALGADKRVKIYRLNSKWLKIAQKCVEILQKGQECDCNQCNAIDRQSLTVEH